MVALVTSATYSSEGTSAVTHSITLPTWTVAARQRVFIAVGAYPGSSATTVPVPVAGSPFVKVAEQVNTNFGAQITLFAAEASAVTPGTAYGFTYPATINRVDIVATVLSDVYGAISDMVVSAGTGTTNATTGAFTTRSLATATWPGPGGFVLVADGHVGPNTGANPLVATKVDPAFDFLVQKSTAQSSGRNYLVFQTGESYADYEANRGHTFTAAGVAAGNAYATLAVIIPSLPTLNVTAAVETTFTRRLTWNITADSATTLTVTPPTGITLTTPSGLPNVREFTDTSTRTDDLVFGWTVTDSATPQSTKTGTLLVPGYADPAKEFAWNAAAGGWGRL